MFAAEQFSISVAEAEEMIRRDWERIGKMTPGWIPAVWRDSRLMYALRVESPRRWIDLTAAETIAALNAELAPTLTKITNPPTMQVTLSTLTGDDRRVNWAARALRGGSALPGCATSAGKP